MTRPPDPSRGDPILAETVRYLLWLADHPTEVVPPLARTSDGAIYLAEDPPRLRHAKTRTGGIAAATVTQMTSATVDLWTASPTGALTAVTGATATAWNKATAAIGANKHIMIQTDENGLEIAVWEMC